MLKVYRTTLVLGLIFCIINITGCREKTNEEIFIIAQNTLNELESYSATISYRVMEDGEEREYRLKQWVSMPACFKIQLMEPDNLVGKTIVSDGKEILVEHSRIGDSLRIEVEDLEQRRPLFIGDFLKSFWMAEDVSKRIHIDEGVKYLVLTCPSLEAGVLGGIQELWLRAPNITPSKMVTYNEHNEVTSLILFEEFDHSWQGGQDFFQIGE
ncbi:MAG: hypothetical protein GX375_00430 [Clostridiales bacterium]|nr:hypothetical protein [Clostridiales bacterium]